ncbi:MAG: aminotransferase class V-fold PLP-dependent enzyme [Fimbriimonadaceae bacterium]
MSAVVAHTGLDISHIRADFPILVTTSRGAPLAYLDNGATSQKPLAVIEAMNWQMRNANANIHRGVYQLSQLATELYEQGRKRAQLLLGAAEPAEVIFTKGCTEAINLVASAWGAANLKAGDAVLLSELEHHSNIVPWQLVAERTGATIGVIPIDGRGVLDLDKYASLLAVGNVKMVAVTHVSNVLGTVTPIRQIAELAHAHGARLLVDGAQAAPHHYIDVQALDADFYAVAVHKMYGPMGLGLLYGKRTLLEAMPPYQGGGDMIETVSFERSTYSTLPAKFEAGTPNVCAAHGFSAAVDYVASLGEGATPREKLASAFGAIDAHEQALLSKATQALERIDGLTVHGTAPGKSAILSFTIATVHPHDLATVLDSEGVAIRAGHHCCMPLMKRLGVPATARASFGLYNTYEEVDALERGVRKAVELLG